MISFLSPSGRQCQVCRVADVLLSEQVTTSKADQLEANPRSRDQSEAWDDIKKAWDLGPVLQSADCGT